MDDRYSHLNKTSRKYGLAGVLEWAYSSFYVLTKQRRVNKQVTNVADISQLRFNVILRFLACIDMNQTELNERTSNIADL